MKGVTFHTPSARDVIYVSKNIRVTDAYEIYNASPFDDPYSLAQAILFNMERGGFAMVTKLDDKPVHLIGWDEIHPGVLQAWAFGTDEFTRVSTRLSKFVKRKLRPPLLTVGYHRLQADSHAKHFEAHKWLKFFGLKVESIMHGFGRDGSDYIRFFGLRNWFDVPTQATQAPEAASASGRSGRQDRSSAQRSGA